MNESRNRNPIRRTNDSGLIEILDKAWSLESMKTLLTEIGLDIERMPIGKITKEHITRAYKILNDLEKAILSNPMYVFKITCII